MVSRLNFGALSCLLSLAVGARMKRDKQTKSAIAGFNILNYRDDANDFVIIFRSGTDGAAIDSACDGRCSITGTPDKGGVPFAAVRGKDRLSAVVEARPESVEILEVDEIDSIFPIINPGPVVDTLPAEGSPSWGTDAVGVPKASTTGKGVHVYVLDTGIRATHQEFEGRVIPAVDFSGDFLRECDGVLTCAEDRHSHGTHCAGTVGGKTTGVAREATIHAIKTLSDAGPGLRSWQFGGIDWVTTKGERPSVISMSLGGLGVDAGYVSVIDAAVAAGVVVVLAAGNDNLDACGFSPAYVPSAITVGAVDKTITRAGYSNFGFCNDIYAPGSDILSSAFHEDWTYIYFSGTSMACPHVSGAAALLLQTYPTLTTSQVLVYLKHGGKGGVAGRMPGDPDLFLNVEMF